MVSINGEQEAFPYLRLFRTLLNTILIGFAFNNVKVSTKTLFYIGVWALFLNSMFISVEIIHPDIVPFLGRVFGYDKSVILNRAFGLTAGYDSAGFLCVLGEAFTVHHFTYIKKKRKQTVLLFFVFFISSLFTGRSSIVLSILIFLWFQIKLLKTNLSLFKVISFVSLGGFLFTLLYLILPILLQTIPFISNLLSSDSFTVENTELLLSTYSKSSEGVWLNMWFLPTSEPFGILLGLGRDSSSDIGYVKILSMIGFFGLFCVFIFYILIYYEVNKYSNRLHGYSDLLIRCIKTTIILIFVFNLKTLYFFTRGFHELLMVLYFGLLNVVTEKKKNKKKHQ
jgi:hypothetical protein